MAIRQLQDRDPISASKNPRVNTQTRSDRISAGILTPGVRLLVGFTQRVRKDDSRRKQTKKNPPAASEELNAVVFCTQTRASKVSGQLLSAAAENQCQVQ